MNRKLLACLLPIWLGASMVPAEVVKTWDFNTPGDTEDWMVFKHMTGLTVSNAVSGGDSVLTAEDITDIDPQVRYNDGGTATPLWLSPGSSNWSTLTMRLRQLDRNPGDPGVVPLTWPSPAAGTLVFFNQGLGNGLNTGGIQTGAGWSIQTQADGWIVASRDISALGTNWVKSLRVDPIGQDTTGNFEIDYIRLESQSIDPQPGAPNVIFIIADDMGYSDAGCYGGEIDTPNIDRLAAEGLRFRQFYNNAKCETTRSALMSGLYHGRCGLRVQNGTTLGSAMQSGGYRTYAVGKWHLSDSNGGDGLTPIDRGFHNYYGHYVGASSYFPSGIGANRLHLDTQDPGNFVSAYDSTNFIQDTVHLSRQATFAPGFYMTDAFGDNAIAFIDDAVTVHTNRPFFMYLSFNAPHTPLQAPVPLINKYRNTYTNGWDVMRQEKWQRQLASGLVDSQWQLSNLRDDIPRWADLDAAQRDAEDHRRAVYAAMIDSMDQNIGKVLDRLDELDATTHPGIVDNTLVIFCSDNGAQAFDNATPAQRLVSPDHPDSLWNPGSGWAAFSNTPWRYYKQSQQQGGICAPFVARWPETIAPGLTTDQPAHVIDVMATLVEIGSANYTSLVTTTGAPAPPLDGASLLPIFEGGTRPAPDYWGFEFGASDFAVIQGDWKLASFSSSPWRLFNLRDDRTETRNLRWENPLKTQELANLYDQWAIDTYGNATRTFANRDTRAQLTQELRYLEPITGDLYREPSVGITVTNIGGSTSTVQDHWEIVVVESSAAGVAGTADDITFVCKPFFGDGEVIVQVDSISNALAAGQAGVMIRETLDPDSALVMAAVDAAGQGIQLSRMAAASPVTASPGIAGLSAPVFLRVKRVAHLFTSSYSTNGYDWVDMASVTNDMSGRVFAGVAAASATVHFREWDYLDVAEYPGRPRTVDGLPALLGYALGADAVTDATSRLPSIRMANAFPAAFPELIYSRRTPVEGLVFGIDGGSDLDALSNDSPHWAEINKSPNPDGVSEQVVFRRTIDAAGTDRTFFTLNVALDPSP